MSNAGVATARDGARIRVGLDSWAQGGAETIWPTMPWTARTRPVALAEWSSASVTA